MAMEQLPSLEAATALVEEIVKQRKRWGGAAGAAQYSTKQVVDALLVIFEGADAGSTDIKAELAKKNRQLGAANARETAHKRTIDDLRGKLMETEQHRDALGAQLKRQDLEQSVLQEDIRQREERLGELTAELGAAEKEAHENLTAVDVYSERTEALREFLRTLDGQEHVGIASVLRFLDGKFDKPDTDRESGDR